jgi:outer membrane biosynthesis protein TonB
MELNARLYLAKSSAGPVLAIASLSGIKSNPAAYSDFARFNSYIDAFKNFFPAKVRPKEAVTKLTLVSSRPFHGHTGRSYKLTIGDLSGSVHAFATRKRFYAIVSLNTKKDEELEEKFLSSFVLPERQIEQPRVDTAAATEKVLDPDDPNLQKQNPQPQTPGDPNQPVRAENKGDLATDVPNNPQQNPQQPQEKQKRGPIAGGILNSKAIYMPIPELGAGEAGGTVLVAVLVDEQGGVVEARAVSGPAHLHAVAVNAARLARFAPTMLMGEPIKVSGTLSYNFKSN